MAQKRDDYDEEDSEDAGPSKLTLDKITIVTLIAFIAISVLFLYLLSVKTEATFGLKEIVFAIVSGIVIILFLIWTRFLMTNNKYLGAFISIAGIIAIVYALTRKY